MDVSGQVGLGWLVIDEQGTITHLDGDIPEEMISEDGVLSDDALGLVVSLDGLTLADVLSSIRSSRLDAAEGAMGIPRWRGSETQLLWTARSLTAVAGGRAILLTLQRSSVDSCADDAEESYRDAFHLSPVGMFRTSLNGRYLEVNLALAQLYGYQSPRSMMDNLRNISRRLYVKRRRRLEFVEMMRSQGVVRDFQSEIFRADGSIIWITEFARTVVDGDGKPKYFEGTVFDISDHKAAQNELGASREQFRRLVETISVVPWEAEASTGLIRYVGPQAQQLLNFPVSDWFREGFWRDRLHPADRDWVKIVRDDAIKSLGQFESEYRMLNAQDEVIWVRDIVSVVETSGGERILGGFLHNITHRRAAEEALRENQDFIEQIANASPLIWYVLDVDANRIIYLNGGGIRILGFSKDSLLKMKQSFFLELAHPTELDEHRDHFERLSAIQRGEYLDREFRMRTASGGWVWVRTHEAILRVLESGRVHQVVGIAEDITLQRAALENLANSEALFRRLAETTRVIPFELDLAPVHFTYIGPQAGELLGFQPSEWLDSDFWSTVVHPEDRQRVEDSLLGIMLNPDAHDELELRLRDKNGEYHWVRQVLRSEAVDDGQLIGRGYLLDISASKSMEAEREESRRQLRELALQNQRAREEERLAMSREIHDELGQALTLLRIDLTWIGSRISRLLPSGAAGPLMGKIREMEADIGKTLQIVRRITTQLRPPLLDEFGLADAIEWQVRDFSRRVGVRCDVSAQSIDCDCKNTATVVFRIFQELLTNVARHSKASRVRVFLKQMSGVLYLSVSDNGCGFELRGARKKAGLGLLGMRERAEALRGKLQIESSVGEGTTVTLCVPINTATAHQQKA